MIKKAKDVLLEQSKGSNAAIKKIVDYLINFMDEPFATKVVASNKTINGMINYITNQARKLANNGVACVGDEEVYSWAVHYFDENEIKEEVVLKSIVNSKVIATEPKKEVSKVEDAPVKKVTTKKKKEKVASSNIEQLSLF